MFSFSLEMIDYQVKDKFPGDLASIVSSIYEDLDSGKLKDNEEVVKKYGARVCKLIKDRFGLNMLTDPLLHNYMPAAILPFSSDYLLNINKAVATELDVGTATKAMLNMFNPQHKELVSHLKKVVKEREDSYKRIHNKKGYVDNKYAKVGGYLSEVRHYLIVNYVILKEMGLTPKETAAVITHEVGHAFLGLETHYKLSTTNSAISNVLEDLNKNKPDRAYYTFKRYFGDKELKESMLSKDSDIVDFYGPLASRYIKELNSVNMNNKYDETNFENLADSFATRMGMGGDVVTGLNKIHALYDGTVHTSVNAMYLTNFVNTLVIAGFTLIFIPPLGGVLIALLLALRGSSNIDMTYDLPLDRYNRIRNSIVDNLKDTRLPKDYTLSLLDQFDTITKILEVTYQRKGILDTVADIFIPKNRDVVYYRNLQQKTENALNNILFVNSARLRTS